MSQADNLRGIQPLRPTATLQYLPLAAAQTIACGDPVRKDMDGQLVIASATSPDFCGIAAQSSTLAAAGTLLPVWGDPDELFVIRATGASAAVEPGRTYDITGGTGAVELNQAADLIHQLVIVRQIPDDDNTLAACRWVVKIAKHQHAKTQDDSANMPALPIAATTAIVAGTAVCRNAAGYLVPAANTAGLRFAGIALESVDNTAGGDGALSCRVRQDGIHRVTAAGLTVADQGQPFWVQNATTVTRTPGHVFCGVSNKHISATVASLDIGAAIDHTVPATFPTMQPLPVAATTVIVAGTLVCFNANGYIVPAANTPGFRFAGVAYEGADNAAGADGAVFVYVRRTGMLTVDEATAGLTPADMGGPVWISDATTVTVTPSHVFCGVIRQNTAVDECIIDIGSGAHHTVPSAHPNMQPLEVAAATVITAGEYCCFNATGYLVPAAGTAGFKFAGIAYETVDNAAGADGAEVAYVRRDGVQLTDENTGALTVLDQGQPVWVHNATTVTRAPGYVRCGVIRQITAVDECVVDIEPGVAFEPRIFTLCVARGGALGADTLMDGAAFERAICLRRAYARILTVPGGADTATVVFTDGVTPVTLTFGAADNDAANAAIDQHYAAAAAIDIATTNSGVAAADLNAIFEIEEL